MMDYPDRRPTPRGSLFLRLQLLQGDISVGISERGKEIKRRRHRKIKMAQIRRRAAKATESEKVVLAEKIRKLTPGAEVVITALGLEDRS